MLRTACWDLLRCAQETSARGRCLGLLEDDDDVLRCPECAAGYRVVNGVPVLRPEHGEAAENWFEAMYQGRSRHQDLASDYLRSERAFMQSFAREKGVRGPCLEVGCGTGGFAELVPEYIGFDYSFSSLMAEGFEAATRICGDARWLPLASSSMECVFSFNTLEHVPDVERAFAEIDRVLKPGGFLVLKPAWHCTRYVTELIPVRGFAELNARQRLVKALLPIIRSKPYKLVSWVPVRMARRLTRRPDNPLRWGRLTPYHGEAWISDADAVASIDCHEGILYYTSRGYSCLSHPTALRQVLAGHDLVVLQKGL